jgi:hypothetical protein
MPAPINAQFDLVKKTGKMTYTIAHFNLNSRETISNKIICILRNEVSKSDKISRIQDFYCVFGYRKGTA